MLDYHKKTLIWKKKHFWFGLAIVIIFYSPYIILGQDSVWYANDYTELVIHWFKLLIDHNAILKPNDYPIIGMLDVLPRGSFASEFYLKTWLFYLLTPYQAILINKLLIHLTAYVSAYHFLTKISHDWMQGPKFLYALCWACIPFWPEAGIGLALTPSVFWVFYKLSQGSKISFPIILLILVLCFYSYFHLNGIFLVLILAAYGLYTLITQKVAYRNYWLMLSFLTVTYLLFNYRMFDIYFFQRDWFTPHRIEYDIYSFGRYHKNVGYKLKHLLLFGEIHAVLISPILYFTLLGYLIFSNYFKTESNKYIFLLKVFIGVNFVALIASLLTYIPLIEKLPIIEKINQFSFERFYYLIYPFLIFAFILIVDQMTRHMQLKKYGWLLITLLLTYNFLVLDDNTKNKILKPIVGIGNKYPTFKQFFAEEQFTEIKDFLHQLGHQDYKVVSVGMHPAIASFNGLHALDGYTGNYPLRYKNEFYEIIKDELGADDRKNWLYWHFKGWGNKAYMFNHTNNDDFMRLKWFEPTSIDAPKYNYEKLKEMGCSFILSADLIINESKLELINTFEHDRSAWIIHLYEIQ
ncbi:DUF6044 family protein [Belliella pelovolcani]|uniref:4-amino-4-deoxy-L-arabinose transferase n=1 Tax=Belliella pelovolcani TaxID=529505 RepID=A0A1N7PDL1_9BACT|nr:DUF6044 family protein [Belliella pelovolcani]SIT08723.1 hypothetical protein SAMN05421761_11595 [Belliella pelovolcani]